LGESKGKGGRRGEEYNTRGRRDGIKRGR